MRLGENQTRYIIRKFYNECIEFWLREGKAQKEAAELAFHDCGKLKRNPYSSTEELDVGTKGQELLLLKIFE